MNINTPNNLTFTSRNATIRFADDIARRVNKEYPRISSTKLQSLSHIQEHKTILENIWDKIRPMRSEFIDIMDKRTQPQSQIKNVINLIKNQKVGNCGESAFLSLISARVNGIKNCSIAYISSPMGYNYDHSVMLVNDDKPYIIDAWLGFADYIPNAIKKYQNEFHRCFDFREAKTHEMVIREDEDTIFYALNDEFDKKELRKIKKIVPNLVMIKDKEEW